MCICYSCLCIKVLVFWCGAWVQFKPASYLMGFTSPERIAAFFTDGSFLFNQSIAFVALEHTQISSSSRHCGFPGLYPRSKFLLALDDGSHLTIANGI